MRAADAAQRLAALMASEGRITTHERGATKRQWHMTKGPTKPKIGKYRNATKKESR